MLIQEVIKHKWIDSESCGQDQINVAISRVTKLNELEALIDGNDAGSTPGLLSTPPFNGYSTLICLLADGNVGSLR